MLFALNRLKKITCFQKFLLNVQVRQKLIYCRIYCPAVIIFFFKNSGIVQESRFFRIHRMAYIAKQYCVFSRKKQKTFVSLVQNLISSASIYLECLQSMLYLLLFVNMMAVITFSVSQGKLKQNGHSIRYRSMNKMNCEHDVLAYNMFNVYKNQISWQTRSRNLTDPRTLPTIWHTYMKLVTKYQISAINSC